jgi:flagellar biosynthesis/type III secretory pathway protein FliH
MQRLKLLDGSYINPAAVERLEVKKHFFGKNYYLQMRLDNGRTIDVCIDLPEAEAQKARLQFEQQLEALNADISAYKEGQAAGLSRGKRLGYANGRSDGYNEGFAAGLREPQDQAWQAGVTAVIEQLEFQKYRFQDEMRYDEYLIESRRQSLISMMDLIDSVIENFRPQQQLEFLNPHTENP